MENETPFLVDADEDARLQAATASDVTGDIRAANPAGQLDKGGVTETVHEETPLLSNEGTYTRLEAAGLPDDEDDERHNTPWLGAKEFEAKSWWRRPSVSFIDVSQSSNKC